MKNYGDRQDRKVLKYRSNNGRGGGLGTHYAAQTVVSPKEHWSGNHKVAGEKGGQHTLGGAPGLQNWRRKATPGEKLNAQHRTGYGGERWWTTYAPQGAKRIK